MSEHPPTSPWALRRDALETAADALLAFAVTVAVLLAVAAIAVAHGVSAWVLLAPLPPALVVVSMTLRARAAHLADRDGGGPR